MSSALEFSTSLDLGDADQFAIPDDEAGSMAAYLTRYVHKRALEGYGYERTGQSGLTGTEDEAARDKTWTHMYVKSGENFNRISNTFVTVSDQSRKIVCLRKWHF